MTIQWLAEGTEGVDMLKKGHPGSGIFGQMELKFKWVEKDTEEFKKGPPAHISLGAILF